jgi:hypothetical protein
MFSEGRSTIKRKLVKSIFREDDEWANEISILSCNLINPEIDNGKLFRFFIAIVVYISYCHEV